MSPWGPLLSIFGIQKGVFPVTAIGVVDVFLSTFNGHYLGVRAKGLLRCRS